MGALRWEHEMSGAEARATERALQLECAKRAYVVLSLEIQDLHRGVSAHSAQIHSERQQLAATEARSEEAEVAHARALAELRVAHSDRLAEAEGRAEAGDRQARPAGAVDAAQFDDGGDDADDGEGGEGAAVVVGGARKRKRKRAVVEDDDDE